MDARHALRFYDPESDFTLDLAGFSPVACIKELAAKHQHDVAAALRLIASVEAGEIANHTAVAAESEDRAVDHYNLRMENSPVEGKSLADSLAQWEEVKAYVDQVRSGAVTNEDGKAYTDVVFNGIGGSYLGPLFLVIATHGDGYNFASGLEQRLHFVCNTDPESFSTLFGKLDLKTTIMVNMSKSGSTAETRGNMDAFNALLVAAGLEEGKHNIAITTPNSKFDVYAQSKGFLNIFRMHNETGGRTSVGSAIGMVPAAFAGIDFAGFLQGQCHMDVLTRRAEATANPAMIIALALQSHMQKSGRKNVIMLGYSDALKEFAHYLQQLYMESLGKEYALDGRTQPEGLTMFGGVGTGEQHAFMQQVQKGISDAVVRFVNFRHRKADFGCARAGSTGRQLLAFVKGTEAALWSNGKPFFTTTYSENSAFNLGMMIALEERIVTILAAFKGLNAFDQPGVQDGKLAADVVNDASIYIATKLADTKFVAAHLPFVGTAAEFRAAAKIDVSLTVVDSILSDLEANRAVQDAYPGLEALKMSREFKDGEFVYSISA